MMLPEKLTVTENRRALYEQKTLEEREEAKAKYQEEIRSLTAERVLGEEALRKLLSEKDAERTKAAENEARHRKSLRQQHDGAVSAVQEEIARREAELKDSLLELGRQREQELSGQGADTQALSKCESEIKQMEAFCMAAEKKSFSEAARALYLTQPTISSHIRSLEQELGCTLFKRTHKQVILTPEGSRLYPYLRRIIDLKEEALREMNAPLAATLRRGDGSDWCRDGHDHYAYAIFP